MLDILQVYRDAGKRTLASFKNQARDALLAFLFPVVFCILLHLIFAAVPTSLAFGAGFIQFIVSMYLLTYYMAILYLFIKKRPLTMAGIRGEAGRILSNIWTVCIVIWLIQVLFASFIPSSLTGLIIFLFANPVDEMVYLDGDHPRDLPQHFVDFYRVNGLHWFLSLLIYLLVMAFIGGRDFLSYMLFQQTLPEVIYGPVGVLGLRVFLDAFPFLVLQLVHFIYVVFRGHLYEILAHSNPRKRAYMREWES